VKTNDIDVIRTYMSQFNDYFCVCDK